MINKYGPQIPIMVPQTLPTGSSCDYCGSTDHPLHGGTEYVIWFACCRCYGQCEIGESGFCDMIKDEAAKPFDPFDPGDLPF